MNEDARKQYLICAASDADGTNFRVCRDQAEAMAFYKEMWGEDQGGGIQSQIDHFADEDNWSEGMTYYHCELYCSTFRVWRVDADEIAIPFRSEATQALTPERLEVAVRHAFKFHGVDQYLATLVWPQVWECLSKCESAAQPFGGTSARNIEGEAK